MKTNHESLYKKTLQQIILSILVFMLIFVLATRMLINQMIDNEFTAFSSDTLNHTLSDITGYFSEKEEIINAIQSNTDLFKNLSRNNYNTKAILNQYIQIDSNISNIVITRLEDGFLYYNNGDHYQGTLTEPFNEIITQEDTIFYMLSPYTELHTGKKVISISKLIAIDNDYYTIALLITVDHFQTFIQSLITDNHTRLFIVDDALELIYPNNETDDYLIAKRVLTTDYLNFISENTSKSERFVQKYDNQLLVAHDVILDNKLHVIINFNKERYSLATRKTVTQISLVSFFILVGIFTLFTRKILLINHSLLILNRDIDTLKSGKISPAKLESAYQEFDILEQTYNEMITSMADLVANIKDITKGIHQYASSITEDANANSRETAHISNAMTHMSIYTSEQFDLIKNVSILSKAIGNKMELANIMSRNFKEITDSTLSTADQIESSLNISMQKSAVNDLALRNLKNGINGLVTEFKTLYQLEQDLNQSFESNESCSSDFIKTKKSAIANSLEIINQNADEVIVSLEETITINISLGDALEIAFDNIKSIEWLVTNINNGSIQLIEEMDTTIIKKKSILKLLDTLTKTAEQNTHAMQNVMRSIDEQRQSVKNMSHEISNLYKISIKLSNQIAKYETYL